MISPEPWNHIFVSKHHYATHLAERGNVVFFLNPPSHKQEVRPTVYQNVYQVDYKGFVKGVRFFPSIVQKMLMRRSFEELQEQVGALFDVVWSFDNSVFYDFSALPKSVLKIAHVVDLNQDFQTEKSAKTAQICFCTSQPILERLQKFNPRTFKINHGFTNQDIPNILMPLPGKASVRALYAGNLAIPYLDWCLLHQIVIKHPEVDFIFVGPGDELTGETDQQQIAKQKVKSAINTFFTGRASVSELRQYQVQVDVLLVVYQEKFQKGQTTNPHKMMEYLGIGKMIVSTYTAEYIDVESKGLFLMSRSNKEFPDLFTHAIQDLASWNETQKQRARRQVALNNTYSRQIDRIENLLK